jgi:hypothetical protein
VKRSYRYCETDRLQITPAAFRKETVCKRQGGRVLNAHTVSIWKRPARYSRLLLVLRIAKRYFSQAYAPFSEGERKVLGKNGKVRRWVFDDKRSTRLFIPFARTYPRITCNRITLYSFHPLAFR